MREDGIGETGMGWDGSNVLCGKKEEIAIYSIIKYARIKPTAFVMANIEY